MRQKRTVMFKKSTTCFILKDKLDLIKLSRLHGRKLIQSHLKVKISTIGLYNCFLASRCYAKRHG